MSYNLHTLHLCASCLIARLVIILNISLQLPLRFSYSGTSNPGGILLILGFWDRLLANPGIVNYLCILCFIAYIIIADPT